MYALILTWVLADPPAPGRHALTPQTQRERFDAVVEEYDGKRKAFVTAYREAPTKEARQKISDEMRRSFSDLEYARRFRAIAGEALKSPTAVEALCWTVRLSRPGPEALEAVERLRQDHAASPRMAWVCGKLWARADSVAEPLFRAVLETNPDRDAQGQACLALASMLVEAAALPRVIAEGPEMAGKVEAFYGKEHLEGLLKRDPLDLQKEGEALYERIVERYADVRWNVDDVNDRRTLREPAEKYLLEKREMAVGKRAPEIEGLDVDGKTLRLSDHRGEVVVLVFWATWCKHCMEMIPHKRELLKRHKAARFALLGVNCDSTREKMRRGMTEESITWPNWFDGSVNAGPIAARYHVASLPTIYVLDADGVIRARDVRGKALNAAVETLLARESRTPAAESPPRERPNP